MSIRRRLAILGGASAALAASLLVGSPAATAAPTTGTEFAVVCDDLGEFTVVAAPAEAAFAAVFIPGTNQVFVPYSVIGVATAPNGEVVMEFEEVKAAPLPTDAITCTFEGTVEENGVTITLTGTAVIVQRGAPA